MKYLVVKGCAGLGNRLITLKKAIEYANKTGRTIFVDWDDGMFTTKGENAFYKFFDLKNVSYTEDKSCILNLYKKGASCYPSDLKYEELVNTAIEQFRVVTPKISKFILYKYVGNYLLKGKFTYLAGLQSVQRTGNGVLNYIDVVKNIRHGDNMPMGGVLCKNAHDDIMLYYDRRPIVDISNITNYIVLKKHLSDMVDEYTYKYRIAEAIGIHVRYTDKKPFFFLNRLYDKVGGILNANPNQRIFLCTDNVDVLEEFYERFGKNVFQIDKYLPKVPDGYGIHSWARANYDKVIKERMALECILDMWLLSRCKELYWQGNSSFSYISKYLKNDSKTTDNWMKLW